MCNAEPLHEFPIGAIAPELFSVHVAIPCRRGLVTPRRPAEVAGATCCHRDSASEPSARREFRESTLSQKGKAVILVVSCWLSINKRVELARSRQICGIHVSANVNVESISELRRIFVPGAEGN